jgi:FecR protein
MHNQPIFRLNRQALIAAVISAAFPMVSHAAAAGRVEFAMGNVTASGTDGHERVLAKGAEINAGDTIQTADGRTQIKFTDGGYMSLQPNTQFKVDDYAFEGKADGSEKGFFKLVKGSLRAITGAIGHTNRATYRINTPVATIGIRGTELTGEYTEQGDDKKLVVHVSGGSVFLENGGGDLILFQGQSGVVTDENIQPNYTDEEPKVTAAGPHGGNPQENHEQQQQQQEQSNTFVVGELVNPEGVPDAIAPDPLLAVIASYAAASAEGVYFLDTAVANSGHGGNGAPSSLYTASLTSDSVLKANFGSYQISADIGIVVTVTSLPLVSGGVSPGTYTGSFAGSGDISHSSAGFNLSLIGQIGNAPGSGSGALCHTGGCNFNAAGLFSGPTAQNAGISYEINNLNGPGCSPPCGSILGTAGFNAPIPPPFASFGPNMAPGAITAYQNWMND